MVRKQKTVEIVLGDLKTVAAKEAKRSGITLNEFICNALESRIRVDQDYSQRKTFVRHGGKHLFGKSTGYEVTEDGRYYPAPLWVRHFEQLFAERGAIYGLVSALQTQAQERLIAVEKSLGELRDRLIEDIGLDPQKEWAYHYGGGKHYMQEVIEKPSEEFDVKGATA